MSDKYGDAVVDFNVWFQENKDLIQFFCRKGFITHILGSKELLKEHGFDEIFERNFNGDDWDYFIVGTDEYAVRAVAEALYVCDYTELKIGEKCFAVTYHA